MFQCASTSVLFSKFDYQIYKYEVTDEVLYASKQLILKMPSSKYHDHHERFAKILTLMTL